MNERKRGSSEFPMFPYEDEESGAERLAAAAEKILKVHDPALINEIIRTAEGEVVPARARLRAIAISNEEYLALADAAESYRRGRKR